jgi:DNA polymerase V
VVLPLPVAAPASAGQTNRCAPASSRPSGDGRSAAKVPLISNLVECGFPSPADDDLDRPVDVNELVIETWPQLFAVRVAGESMLGAGIFPGDIAVVNRARVAVDGAVVLALLGEEFTLNAIAARQAPGCKPKSGLRGYRNQ